MRQRPAWAAPVVKLYHTSLLVVPHDGVIPSSVASALLAVTVADPLVTVSDVAEAQVSFAGGVRNAWSTNGPVAPVVLHWATRMTYGVPAVSVMPVVPPILEGTPEPLQPSSSHPPATVFALVAGHAV